MVLIAYAPVDEIYSQRNVLINESIVFTFVVLILVLGVSLVLIRRITLPIKEITQATKHYANGNWDVPLKCNTNDELRELTNSILTMAENTKNYIADINQMAYTDGLTGLRNKASYLEYVQELNERIADNKAEFAIVSLDLNGLKEINDTYGHDEGDKLIKKASELLCSVFNHSSVFRFGGDEFFVIMETDDYIKRKSIIEKFQSDMLASAQRKDGSVVIASGLASVPEDCHNYDAAFRIADERMYNNKLLIKEKSK